MQSKYAIIAPAILFTQTRILWIESERKIWMLKAKELVGKAHEKAFSSQQQEVKSSLFDQVNAGTVASMLELCSRYVTLLRAEGLEIDSYQADQLKIRLQRHFGDSLVFFS